MCSPIFEATTARRSGIGISFRLDGGYRSAA
jgi:hypothetical protein